MGNELLQNDAEETAINDSIVDEEILPAPQDIMHNQEVESISVEDAVKIQNLDVSELISEIKKYCKKEMVSENRNQIEEIRSVFYKKLKNEIESQKQQFINNGGKADDFIYKELFEEQFKDVYSQIKVYRTDILIEQEKEKTENLQKRLAVIEELKELINTEESFDKTFKEFRNLQERWREIGPIHQAEIKSVWEKYHHHVSMFYDYVKINKELRDLDLKKNFEAKIELCEKAEALIFETQIVKAFAKLQNLHDLWREIGPVPENKKEELWQRFKEATTKINKAHQDYFLSLKEQEKSNLEAKSALCEKIEEINLSNYQTVKQWNQASEDVASIQKLWKTIGFAPQKYNTQVYDRFCKACDDFFARKREYFHSLKSEEEIHIQKRIELCMIAEEMKTRTDWKSAANDFLDLQKKWKELPPVSHKESAKLWNRFRNACDVFFNERQKFYQTKEQEQIHNLELKKELILKIENLQVSDEPQTALKELQEIQRQWSEIGFVPAKKKDKIQNQYKEAIQKQFNAINLPQEQKQKALYKVKVESLLHESKGNEKIIAEAVKLQNKIKSIENDIFVLENNIGFFAKSKNAEKLIQDVQLKIKKGKEEIEAIKQQLRVIHSIKDGK